MKHLTIIFLFFIVLSVLLTGCTWDPPRDNPADPGSAAWEGKSRIRFTVKSTFTAFPLEGAVISIDQGNNIDTTDTEGIVELVVPIGTLNYKVQLPGYKSVEGSTEVKYEEIALVPDITLDAQNTIDTLIITSGMLDNAAFDNNFFYNVYAEINNPDGYEYIESVFFNSFDGTTYEIAAGSQPGIYTYSQELGLTGEELLPGLINENTSVIAINPSNDTTIAYDYLKVFLNYPLYNDMGATGNSIEIEEPVFNWYEPQTDLYFETLKYTFTLYEDDPLHEEPPLIEGPVELINEQTYTLLEVISPGHYFWELTLSDPLGNWIRTRLKPIRIR